MGDPVIVAACRTAVGKAKRGALVHTRPDDMGATVLQGVVDRAGIKPEQVEDVILGCAMPEAEQGMNVARMAVHCAGWPDEVPAMTINRYCCSGIQSTWQICTDIMADMISVGIGGGTETMSMIPMGGNKIVPNIKLAETYPQAYVSMGQTAENVAIKYGVTRQEQDEWALRSNNLALKAITSGAFKEQIVPLPAYLYDGKGKKKEFVFEVDEGPRASTIEGLASLRPAFANPKSTVEGAGSVTAGNASQMSDGAGAVLVMDRAKAGELGCTPMGKLHGFRVVAFDPDYMGIGPALAIPKLFDTVGKKLGLTYKDIDCWEINEAFASQAIYSVKVLDIDADKVNPSGGAIALGHPLGATGAKLTTQVLYWLKDNKKKWGVVSMCIGGGMGAAGLIENYLL